MCCENSLFNAQGESGFLEYNLATQEAWAESLEKNSSALSRVCNSTIKMGGS